MPKDQKIKLKDKKKIFKDCWFIWTFIHSFISCHPGTHWAPVWQTRGWAFWIRTRAALEPCLGRSKGTSVSKEMITAQVPPQGQRHRAEDLGLFQ